MHVVFHLLRHIIVDHKLDLVNVKTTTGHICCDKHRANPAFFELLEQLLSHLLRLITVDALDSLNALLVELLDKVVDTFLGGAEDNCARLAALCLQLGQQLDKLHVLLRLSAAVDALFDRRVRCHFLLADLDVERLLNIAAVLAGEGLHVLGPRCAEHQRLPVGAHVPHYSLKLLLETHVLITPSKKR